MQLSVSVDQYHNAKCRTEANASRSIMNDPVAALLQNQLFHYFYCKNHQYPVLCMYSAKCEHTFTISTFTQNIQLRSKHTVGLLNLSYSSICTEQLPQWDHIAKSQLLNPYIDRQPPNPEAGKEGHKLAIYSQLNIYKLVKQVTCRPLAHLPQGNNKLWLISCELQLTGWPWLVGTTDSFVSSCILVAANNYLSVLLHYWTLFRTLQKTVKY